MYSKRVINEWFKIDNDDISIIKETFNAIDYLEEKRPEGDGVTCVGENKYLMDRNRVLYMINKGKNYFTTNIINVHSDFFLVVLEP